MTTASNSDARRRNAAPDTTGLREVLAEELTLGGDADSLVITVREWLAARNAAPDTTGLRESLTTAAIVGHKGPNDTDADIMRRTARDMRDGYDLGGSNRRAAVARVLDVVADAIAAIPDPTPEPSHQLVRNGGPDALDTCTGCDWESWDTAPSFAAHATPEPDAAASDSAALTDAEFVAGNACDEILNALPMDSWGHVISCGYDDNDERCECGTLRERLEAIVAARVAKAVEQERAEGYRQGATEGLDSTDRALFGTWRGLAEHMRTLVDVYADASDRALADRDAEWADRIEALADECANAPCIHLNDMYGNLRALLDDTKATS